MKKTYLLGLVMGLLMTGSVFSATGTDTDRSGNKEQFKIESQNLKKEYAAREDRINEYYRQEFKQLKERQSEELKSLHKELMEEYQKLEEKYRIKDPIQARSHKNSKSADKTKKVQPVKKKQIKSTSVKPKKKQGVK